MFAKRGRGAAFGDGRVLHARWFGVVLRRLNIAKHGHSTGLAAVRHLAGGLGWETRRGEWVTGGPAWVGRLVPLSGRMRA